MNHTETNWEMLAKAGGARRVEEEAILLTKALGRALTDEECRDIRAAARRAGIDLENLK